MRLGILGGTFDPVHAGHVELACAAASALNLENVLFIPNANPPHKKGSKITSYEHRVAMLRMTLEDCETAELCEVEARKSAPNYTIDTLANLRKLYGEDTEFFLLLGSDEVRGLAEWKEPRKLVNAVEVVVISRAGSTIGEIDRLEDFLGEEATRKLSAQALCLDLPDISSTILRARIGRGQDILEDVHPNVAAYIDQNKLYQRTQAKAAK
jgi:nicotinate-nucleotide adenylyltransferase